MVSIKLTYFQKSQFCYGTYKYNWLSICYSILKYYVGSKIDKNWKEPRIEKNDFHHSKWNYLLFADKIQTFMKIMMMKKRQYRFIKTPFNVVFILKERHA